MAELVKKKKVNKSVIRITKDDITAMDVDAFVFYAEQDLQLGSGYGNAIAVRGGPKIQEELKELGKQKVGAAVVSGGGRLKAKHIIHAVGPKFAEADTEKKLAQVTRNALKRAEELGIEQVAFPPMGCGFYGVSLEASARITLEVIKEHLEGETKLKEVLVITRDKREFAPFEARLDKLN